MAYRVDTEIRGAGGAPMLSRLNFDSPSGTGSAAEAQSAANAVADFWIACAQWLSEALTWQVLTDVTQFEPSTGQTTATYPVGGQYGVFSAQANPLAWATQGLIRWSTGIYVAGRAVRGRTFVPGLTVSASADGTFGGAAKAAIEDAAQGLVDDADSTLAVVSKGSIYAVTASSVWDQFAVLTSRRD